MLLCDELNDVISLEHINESNTSGCISMNVSTSQIAASSTLSSLFNAEDIILSKNQQKQKCVPSLESASSMALNQNVSSVGIFRGGENSKNEVTRSASLSNDADKGQLCDDRSSSVVTRESNENINPKKVNYEVVTKCSVQDFDFNVAGDNSFDQNEFLNNQNVDFSKEVEYIASIMSKKESTLSSDRFHSTDCPEIMDICVDSLGERIGRSEANNFKKSDRDEINEARNIKRQVDLPEIQKIGLKMNLKSMLQNSSIHNFDKDDSLNNTSISYRLNNHSRASSVAEESSPLGCSVSSSGNHLEERFRDECYVATDDPHDLIKFCGSIHHSELQSSLQKNGTHDSTTTSSVSKDSEEKRKTKSDIISEKFDHIPAIHEIVLKENPSGGLPNATFDSSALIQVESLKKNLEIANIRIKELNALCENLRVENDSLALKLLTSEEKAQMLSTLSASHFEGRLGLESRLKATQIAYEDLLTEHKLKKAQSEILAIKNKMEIRALENETCRLKKFLTLSREAQRISEDEIAYLAGFEIDDSISEGATEPGRDGLDSDNSNMDYSFKSLEKSNENIPMETPLRSILRSMTALVSSRRLSSRRHSSSSSISKNVVDSGQNEQDEKLGFVVYKHDNVLGPDQNQENAQNDTADTIESEEKKDEIGSNVDVLEVTSGLPNQDQDVAGNSQRADSFGQGARNNHEVQCMEKPAMENLQSTNGDLSPGHVRSGPGKFLTSIWEVVSNARRTSNGGPDMRLGSMAAKPVTIVQSSSEFMYGFMPRGHEDFQIAKRRGSGMSIESISFISDGGKAKRRGSGMSLESLDFFSTRSITKMKRRATLDASVRFTSDTSKIELEKEFKSERLSQCSVADVSKSSRRGSLDSMTFAVLKSKGQGSGKSIESCGFPASQSTARSDRIISLHDLESITIDACHKPSYHESAVTLDSCGLLDS